MTAPLLAGNELVGMAWARMFVTVPVVTTLPQGAVIAAEGGCVQVRGVGGSPGRVRGERGPVINYSCWAVRPDSQNPPWDVAEALAERLLRASQEAGNWLLTVKAGYELALVVAAAAPMEPRRVSGDPGNYARFDVDIELTWQPGSTGFGPYYEES